MTRPLIYIAGPYRGETPWHVEQNIRAAEEIGLDVARLGAVPVIPHTMYRHYDKSLPDVFWLEATLQLLDVCDAILLLPTWESSAGARYERDHAVAKGISILGASGLDDVAAWIRAFGRSP